MSRVRWRFSQRIPPDLDMLYMIYWIGAIALSAVALVHLKT
jgi:hypothetical protein